MWEEVYSHGVPFQGVSPVQIGWECGERWTHVPPTMAFNTGFPRLVMSLKPATVDDRWLGLCLGSTAGAVLSVLCPSHMKTCLCAEPALSAVRGWWVPLKLWRVGTRAESEYLLTSAQPLGCKPSPGLACF